MSVNRWQLNKSNYQASIFSSRIDILNKSDYDLLHEFEIFNPYTLQLTQPQLRLHQPNIAPQFKTLIRIAKNKPCITEKLLLQKN